ncbi:MAG: superinfection immunity protein [Wenzhouxiangella sp.]
MPSVWTLIAQTLTLTIFVVLYALPSIIALARRHPKRRLIVVVNLLGGLIAGIGWVVAIVWCFIDDARGGNKQIDQLERLEGLLQRGSLSQEEFERQKAAVLATPHKAGPP